MLSRRVHVRVSGLVQGVSYRASAQHVARELGLGGWVRNLPDGDVELEAQGAADVIERFLVWCRQGPEEARVEGLDVRDAPPQVPSTHFEVRR